MINAQMVKELREISGAGMMDCKAALTANNGDNEKALKWLREKGFAKATKKAERIAAEGLTNVFINDDKAIILEVNSETDFVSKNSEFTEMIDTIGKAILNSDAKTIDEALSISITDGTIKDLIVNKTAKIGEKLSLRRFTVLSKTSSQVFGSYLHMGGKIAALVLLEGANEEVAKDVAMQSAAMKPSYIFPTDVPADVLENEKDIIIKQAMKEGKPEDIAQKMVVGRIKKYYQEVCLSEQTFIKDNSLSITNYINNHQGELINMVRYEVGEGMEKRNEDFGAEVMNQIKNN